MESSPGQDIPGRLLAQQKSSVDVEQYVKECKEKKQLLKETLKELELKQAELKFRQPPSKTRCCWPRDSHANWATTLWGGHVHHGCPNRAPLPPSHCGRPPLLHREVL